MESPLSLQALLTAVEPDDAVDTRIKEAALEQFSLVGIRRTSADDIAKRAGVNRATLYRRMGGREEITRAALSHEVRRTLAEIERGIGDIADPLERHTAASSSPSRHCAIIRCCAGSSRWTATRCWAGSPWRPGRSCASRPRS